MDKEMIIKTKLGDLVVSKSVGPAHPGVYIDLRVQAENGPKEVPLALVEYTDDEADLEGQDLLIARVWGDAKEEDYTNRVVFKNLRGISVG